MLRCAHFIFIICCLPISYNYIINFKYLTFLVFYSYSEAVIEYSAAVDLQPENYIFLNNRGNAFAEMNKLDTAIADYDRCIQLA